MYFIEDIVILMSSHTASRRQQEPLKKPVSKADIRDELLQETERFLEQGGSVNEIPCGISGKDPGDPPLFLNRRLFVEPKSPRTPIPEVVAAIEARRLQKFRHKSQQKRRLPSPRGKILYDDFGEPLRRIWSED
jgi:hypothetical protein